MKNMGGFDGAADMDEVSLSYFYSLSWHVACVRYFLHTSIVHSFMHIYICLVYICMYSENNALNQLLENIAIHR